MESTIKLLRFSIPPFVTLFFILLAKFLNFDIQLPVIFSLTTIWGNVATVVTLGFLISSIQTVILKPLSLHLPGWNRDARTKIKDIFGIQYSQGVEDEMVEWLIHCNCPKNIRDNIQKRWEMFLINIHSAIALLFTPLIIYYTNGNLCKLGWWWLWFSLFMAIFVANAVMAHCDVRKIDFFALEHYKIIEKYGKKNCVRHDESAPEQDDA